MPGIFAIDIGSRLGWAFGPVSGGTPDSGTRQIKSPDESQDAAFGNLIHWLSTRWSKDRPALVVKEAPFNLAAFKNAHNSQAAVELTYGLHAIVRGMCNRFSIRCEDVHAATVRKHFLGKANTGTRAGTKDAVIVRARLLKLIPKDCYDNDRADAVATWDFAAAHFGRRAGVLHLFGEVAA